MALVIPAFARRFELADLIRCTPPRKMFVVSSEDDPFASDANDLVRAAAAAFVAAGCPSHLQHLRVSGPHPLDMRRFDAIVNWTLAQAAGSGQREQDQRAVHLSSIVL